jgi:hypothetical protein
MRQIIAIFVSIVLSASSVFAIDTDVFAQIDSYEVRHQQAVSLLYNLWVTKFDTNSSFMVGGRIRRDEMAAMIVRFADAMGLKWSPIDGMSCAFDDLDQAHYDLVDEIITACQYGMFQWYQWKFMPTNDISQAQVFAVVGRLLDGKKYEW